MKSRLLAFGVVVGGLALAGAGLRWIEAPLWAAVRVEQPAFQLESTGMAIGQGATFGVLGGFRSITADFIWLRAHVVWETRDLPKTATLLRLASAVDPRPLYFWLNGARIVAYDMTAWRIAAAGGDEVVPIAEQERIGAEQAGLALRRLDEAMAFHPASADLWIERANIQLNRLHDTEAAAASYRRAWEQPNAPYYAARLHAELLRRLGRKAEALAWLVKLHPQLPSGDEAACADLVLERIRDLERELSVPAVAAYRVTRQGLRAKR